MTFFDKNKTYVIAEAGSNYNQDLNTAKKLIETAKECGADAIKFQLFQAKVLYPEKNGIAFQTTRSNEFPRIWLQDLSNFAQKIEIDFLATPFDHEAIEVLSDIDIKLFKWGSSETLNKKLLFHVASKLKPILLSTGMCSVSDIAEAVEILEENQCSDITILHCHSLYPTKFEDVNLNVMENLGSIFDKNYGLSDHSLGTSVPIAATALGAVVIEKHITLDRTDNGPDHFYSLEPKEFKFMVENIKNIRTALGSKVKTIFEDEKKYGRRNGIYAKRDINKNDIILKKDLIIKRPAVSIAERFVDVVEGSKAKNIIEKGSPIYWNDISSN